MYKQAPLEAVVNDEDEKKWNEIVSKYKPVDYRQLEENEDTTKLTESAACAGGKCDIIT